MKTTSSTSTRSHRSSRAFSLAELVIASGISVMVITVGALSYQAVTAQQRVSVTYGGVTIGGAAAENYYGKPDTVTEIDAYFAPNYGRATTADLMRETFYDDLKLSSAVYCLGREGLSTLRPSTVAYAGSNDGKALDTPEAFRLALEASQPLLVDVHTAYEPGILPDTSKNLSVYMVRTSPPSLPDTLLIMAIWEIDIQSVTNPRGTYATVRRYSFSILTDVYDVFYPEKHGVDPFNPLFVSFERDVRVISGADDGYDKFRLAKQEPFYFMWWPDPASPTLDGDSLDASPYTSGDPQHYYYNMGGRTSYMFTFPMFPAL